MREAFSEPFSNLENQRRNEVRQKIEKSIKEIFLSNELEKIAESFFEDNCLSEIKLLDHFGDPLEKEFILIVPFEGDTKLLQYCPTRSEISFSFRNPFLDENQIKQVFLIETNSPEGQLQKNINSQLNLIRNNVDNLNKDIQGFNAHLKELVNYLVKDRKDKIQKSLEIVSKLNIPLKKRDDAPKTYVVPIIKKKIELISQKIKVGMPQELEPTLLDTTYENILDIIDNMSQVMERSPSAFVKMEEEHLRTHFLMQLNGQYEGEARGEVFNLEGKTDILINHKGSNLFIAECKFWTGESGLTETINQLLGYISWRDTKTAIILFNKNKDTSKVLAQIPLILVKHQNFIRKEDYSKQNSFRFIMRNKNDSDKHFILTIKVFDIPL